MVRAAAIDNDKPVRHGPGGRGECRRTGSEGGAGSPTPEEVDRARCIIAAYAEASASGGIRVGGRLVEALHAEEARRVVALAEAVARFTT